MGCSYSLPDASLHNRRIRKEEIVITLTEQYSLYEHEYLAAITAAEISGWSVRQVIVIQDVVLVVFERPKN